MWTIVIIIFCIVLNAVLAGIEIAFISVNKTLLRHRAKAGGRKAQKLLELKERPERTLSTIQLGITLLSALSAVIGGASAGLTIVPVLQDLFNISVAFAEILSVAFVVVPITYFIVVIGEITPKALAIRNPYLFATLGVPILQTLTKFLYPIVTLCERSTKWLLRMIPLDNLQATEGELKYRESEKILTGYYKLPDKGKEYMINLTIIQEKTVEHILLDWSEVEYVYSNYTLEELVDKTIATGHTRMPVVEDGYVIGVINTKEVLTLFEKRDTHWKKIIHDPLRLRTDSSPLHTLHALQKRRVHLGVVEDLNGLPIGIVTMEDIIEEILGEIYDEDD